MTTTNQPHKHTNSHNHSPLPAHRSQENQLPAIRLDLKAFEYVQMEKTALALTIVQCTKPSAQHQLSVGDTIYPIILALGTTLDDGSDIDEALFTASYDRSYPLDSPYGSFVVVMPEAFALKLRQEANNNSLTIRGHADVYYKVDIHEYDDDTEKTANKNRDTIKWAWVDIPKGYTQSDAALEAKIKNEFAKRAKLQVTKFLHPTLKNTKIPDTRCRVEFEHTEEFYAVYLQYLTCVDLAWKDVKKEMAVRINVGYLKEMGVCPRLTCYKIRPDVARAEHRDRELCSCADRGLGNGKNVLGHKRARDETSTASAKAAAAWKQRQAAKYAKKDPFA